MASPGALLLPPGHDELPSQGPEVVDFIEGFLTLSGDYEGEPFRPLDFAVDFIYDLYLIETDGSYRYSSAFLCLPRKNTKTEIGVGIALAELFNIAGYPGSAPEICLAASTKDQARKILRKLKRMILAHPDLERRTHITQNIIWNTESGGYIEVTSAESGGNHGGEYTLVIMEELHEWPLRKGRKLYTALTTGFATRKRAHYLVISTVGDEPDGLMGEKYEAAISRTHKFNGEWQPNLARSGKLSYIWGPAKNEKFTYGDVDFYRKVNPGNEIHGSDESIREMLLETTEAEGRKFYYNEWPTARKNLWIMQGLPEKRSVNFVIPAKSDVTLGLDGSRSNDSTALAIAKLFTPVVGLAGLWEHPGNDGWVVPMHQVADRVSELVEQHNVVELCYDPYGMELFEETMRVRHRRLNLNPFSTNQAKKNSMALIEFYNLFISGQVSLIRNPDLLRHFNNCLAETSRAGVRLVKAGPTKKMDGVVATVLARLASERHSIRGVKKRDYSKGLQELGW